MNFSPGILFSISGNSSVKNVVMRGSFTQSICVINGINGQVVGAVEEANEKDRREQKQIVIIDSGSKVEGNIEFASKNGLVIVKNGDEFNGEVIGGIVAKLRGK